MAMSPLPRVPTGNDKRYDPEAVLRGLARAQRCVCTIEGAGSKAGTGILIAPDLVLTNYHVVERLVPVDADFTGAECRFDHRNDAEGRLLQAGDAKFKIVEVIISSEPSPGDLQTGDDSYDDDKLDYAIVRIDTQAGRLKDTEGKIRNWITLPLPGEVTDAEIGMKIHILQHPYQVGGSTILQPLKVAEAEFVDARFTGDEQARFIHDGWTKQGSSGGPCFSTFDKFAFVALHNAGIGTKEDDEARGQAIPLKRIAKDILKYYEQSGRILGCVPPPDAGPDTRARQRIDSIERRKKAALCLMDRSSEENEFLARLFDPAEQQTARPLLHVVVCGQEDAPGYFIDRLAHLSFEATPGNVKQSKLEALTKGLNAPSRAFQPDAWPQLKEFDKRRKELANLVGLLDTKSRHLLVLSRTIDDAWNTSTEEPLLREFAAMLASRFGGNRDLIQAVVFFIVSKGPRTEFAGLWRRDVPPYCGVCVELSRVGLDDLGEWRDFLAKAWNESQNFAEAISGQFSGAALKPLDVVAKGLNESLSRYIADTLDKIGLPKEQQR
jgi:hypothetical protein